MTAGIMGTPTMRLIDVRDMVCAQALARLARAARLLPAGEAVDVLCSAEDVSRDARAWALEHGFLVDAREPMRLRLTRV